MNQRPEYDPKRTGQNLKRLRQQCGYTAEQVSEYIGIGTVQAIYKWERGECFPVLDNFFALAELYGADPSEILIRRETKESECYMEVAASGKKMLTRPLEMYVLRLESLSRNRQS